MKLVVFLRDGANSIMAEVEVARDTLAALGNSISQAATLFTVRTLALDLKQDQIEMRTFSGEPKFTDAKNPDFSLKLTGEG